MIYLECKPDEVLVRMLGVAKKEARHAGDKGGVCNRLRKSTNAKGLIDEDPRSSQPPYLQTLTPHSNEHDIKVLYDKSAGNYLFMLCPKLEGWILGAARKANVDVTQYGLPDDEDKLHKVINSRLRNFENLLNDLKPGSEALKTLENLLKG